MKKQLSFLILSMVICSGCSVLKDLVKKTGEAVNGVIAVPENVVTNSYSQVKGAFK